MDNRPNVWSEILLRAGLALLILIAAGILVSSDPFMPVGRMVTIMAVALGVDLVIMVWR